jgi:hypothetical protein
MSLYSVPIVRRELLALWHDFWDGPKTKAAQEADQHGELGRSQLIEARNTDEAASIAESQNPGYVAIRDAISRHR